MRMQVPKVNLAENADPVIVRPRRRWKRWILIAIFLFGAWSVFSSGSVAPSSGVQALSPLALISRVGRYVFQGGGLKGEFADRVNILILGIGGDGHEGPYLTDTIMVASLKPSTGEAGLISIPRDLAVPSSDGKLQKINTVNAFAEAESKGSGGEAAVRIASEVLDLSIPYYVRVDFRAFKEVVDEVGGIMVYVDRLFADASFPTGVNGETRTVSFVAGWQKMDGARALDYARSRMGSNGEGSDFARSRRQQKVLVALKQKLFSTDTFLDPGRIARVLGTLDRHLKTNLGTGDIIRLIEIGRRVKTDTIRHLVLDDRPDGELKAALLDGVFFLVPAEDSFDRIRRLARDVFNAPSSEAVEPTVTRLEVQNGTTISGLAGRVATKLRTEGFAVVSYGNAAERTHSSTTVYVLSDSSDPSSTKLAELLHAKVERGPPPGFEQTAPPIDFVIILGADANTL